jgi:hypothetical protein
MYIIETISVLAATLGNKVRGIESEYPSDIIQGESNT